MKKYLTLGFSWSHVSQQGTGKDFDPEGTFATSGYTHGCHNWWGSGREDVTGISGVEARDAITHPAMHRTAFKTKNYPSQNFGSSEAEKLCPVGRNISNEKWLKMFEPHQGGATESQIFSTTFTPQKQHCCLFTSKWFLYIYLDSFNFGVCVDSSYTFHQRTLLSRRKDWSPPTSSGKRVLSCIDASQKNRGWPFNKDPLQG